MDWLTDNWQWVNYVCVKAGDCFYTRSRGGVVVVVVVVQTVVQTVAGGWGGADGDEMR